MQAFQKGSPIARDFSESILKLSEDGLTPLEDEWLTPSNECSVNVTSNRTEHLSLQSSGVSTLYMV
jgi:ionotropic glutamate receptor